MPRHFLLFTSLCVGMNLCVLSQTTSNNEQPLSEFQWKNRILLVFSPSDRDARIQQQHDQIMEDWAPYADRDMRVFEILPHTVRELPEEVEELGAAESFRSRYAVAPDEFKVILVGKDGGEKLSSTRPVSNLTLFGLIDQMPMRKMEMRD
ncbi:DUF4174 domain-containing protein [Pontibacter sp. G13]|uniref:DUF4174 domain-containing protein n=1 Tax=Pontibacter sp. G13 TaxID=3074898 RepID=UPI002889611C|nr:DUF4174 domain-containing protein [Pontibacter sp. G13]WNJ18764.1 DUF4174 domain-containing protein [Pontibacter sp. G13]